MNTETEFYAAVKKVCEDLGIDAAGRSYVEMTCLDNADEPARVWDMAMDTLRFFVSTNQVEAAARNEL